MMRICVVGTGYVGLVAGTCLADIGHHVTCVDKDPEKIETLKAGGVPIYEPGLEHLIHRNVAEGRLHFTTDGPAAVANAEVHYVAVGTPSSDDGSADLGGVMAVAEMIGRALKAQGTVIIKSTVPVGTADRVREILGAHARHAFDVVSNPEFLKEGAAIDDFMKPDRIVVGCREERTRAVIERLYRPLVRSGKPILFMDNRSAELSKYASNAFLATRISFINELSLLCERLGADVDAVRQGAGRDSRIGLRFFFPGAGYGGSCFPKDVKALMFTAQEADFPLSILQAVEQVNKRQKAVLATKVKKHFGDDLLGRRFAVWGLSFKPRTDDMREAPSIVVIESLLKAGAQVVAFDPEAMNESRRHYLGDRIEYVKDKMNALDGADALIVITEWNEFRAPDWEQVAQRLGGKVIFDGRNIYDPAVLRAAGFTYHCIGRP